MEKKIDSKTGKSLMQLHLEASKDHFQKSNELYERDNQDPSGSQPRPEKSVGRYGNKRVFVDDQWFASKYESECWMILKYSLQKDGHIFSLSRDVEDCRFYFDYNCVRIAKAHFDFSFVIEGLPFRIIADSKSPSTIGFQRFRWQTKMMMAFYDLPVFVFMQGQTNLYTEILAIKALGLLHPSLNLYNETMKDRTLTQEQRSSPTD